MPTLNPQRPMRLRSMAGVFLIYLICGGLGIEYGTIMGGNSLTLLWLPSGISLAACVIYGVRIWPVIWLGSFATNVPYMIEQAEPSSLVLKGLVFGACAATINTGTQALLAHALFRRAIPDGHLHSTQGILNFLVKVTPLPCMLNILLLVLLYGAGGYIRHDTLESFASVWLAGTLADYHGYFVVGLLGIVWMGKTTVEDRRIRLDRRTLSALALLIVLLAASIFWNEAMVYLITTLGVLVAMNWGLRAATSFVLCISLTFTIATANQVGPFVSTNNFSSMMELLLFVFGLGVPIYLLTVNRYELVQSKLDLENKVIERTQELNAANKRLEALSNNDGLTGLANRRYFDEVLAAEWQRAERAGTPLALAMIDVDWFKKYNDHYGHLAGDQCLRNVARTLGLTVCRTGDQVARYGGEEFVFLAPNTSQDDALAIAQRFCDALHAQEIPHEASPLGRVTASIGVAVMVPDSARTPDALMKVADEALYRAKAQGRNRAISA
ncbi:sensor domain-containing diguanylate cyclase [Phytopseudomonas dryadis]|uniref:diguanylate cyclase n=1 Tax=Phytopseudomonas dryadis TaxID=2487520 RepID=A0A4Q9R594_9GAMM|nr:diguanylate cyclase [Pseudomonas dryadis]TBU95639.1 hypothetical protein DNK44_06880 [Pseudomonas dryadis]